MGNVSVFIEHNKCNFVCLREHRPLKNFVISQEVYVKNIQVILYLRTMNHKITMYYSSNLI